MTHAHPPRTLPSFAPIAREQLWFLVTSLLRIWPFMIPPVVMLAFFAKSSWTHPDSRLFVSGLLALFLAVVAWPQQKTAGGIAYFRSLPPAHWKNASVRTGVVWLVLMALCLASFLVIDSGARGTVPFWISAPALVGATFAFLVLSGVFAATRYALFWLIGAQLLLNLRERVAGSGVADALDPLLRGPVGVLIAITGRTWVSSPDGGGRVFRLEPKVWLLASAVWLTVGLAIFLFAATRRREY